MDFGADTPADAVLIAHVDPYELIGSYSPHAITLDDYLWPSAEHYVQATKFPPGDHFMRILAAPHPGAAVKLGRAWFQRRRPDWRKHLVTYMTRAMYTKCRAWPEVRERLLATGDRPILDCAAWDHYWGCGRDGRGYNHFGRLLVRVRTRLREEDEAGP